LTPDQQTFIERFSTIAVDAGVAPSMGKVMAYMMICQPKEQSAESIQSALRLSVGSVSTALSILMRTGIIERSLIKGTRRYVYVFKEDAVEAMTRRKLASIVSARKVIEEGLRLPQADGRMDAVLKVYKAFERHTAGIIEELGK
jgi:DNA-binding transcriptional regulator GbsR (MarR family)